MTDPGVDALGDRLDALCEAWDAFNEELIGQTPGRIDTGEGRFFFQETAAAWQALHRMDNLVADWQLRDGYAATLRGEAATEPKATPPEAAADALGEWLAELLWTSWPFDDGEDFDTTGKFATMDRETRRVWLGWARLICDELAARGAAAPPPTS